MHKHSNKCIHTTHIASKKGPSSMCAHLKLYVCVFAHMIRRPSWLSGSVISVQKDQNVLRKCVRICTYVQVHVYYIYIYMIPHLHAFSCVCTCIFKHTYLHTHIYTCMCMYTHNVHMYTHMSNAFSLARVHAKFVYNCTL